MASTYLRKIKLAGFKSFVDPITINLQSRVTAIVGPNGCGKSNVIDAVKWVIGESSAKQLRGMTMGDVIFNGSTNRKPLSHASIELTFDNNGGMFGGEYAKYNEIAVRREVKRDGVSSYYLNGVGCRRRDIIDMFLGTGLGLDSYAIIGQGTISQFVEAKPDELRLYLEEAANISKYKERRRETENRMRHTEENLARLQDIRIELGEQLKHLDKQAKDAERYKKLKDDERRTKAELSALCWRDIQNQQQTLETDLKQNQELLTDKVTAQHALEAQIATTDEEHKQAVRTFNEVQEKFYKLGNDIARLEQTVKHAKERKQNLIAELDKSEQAAASAMQQQAQDNSQFSLLNEELAKLHDTKPHMASFLDDAQQKLSAAGQELRALQEKLDTSNSEVANANLNAEVVRTKIQHLEQTIATEKQRLPKLQQDLESAKQATAADDTAELQKQQTILQSQQDELQQGLHVKQAEIQSQRANLDELNAKLNDLRREIQILHGKQASLEALQEAALGTNSSLHKSWLKDKQLADKPLFMHGLEVDSGWEAAVETVLAGYLEAICVDDLNLITNWQDVPSSRLVLFDIGCGKKVVSSNQEFSASELLATKVKANTPLISLLSNIYVADDINQALKKRHQLHGYESIVTRDGVWIGPDWLCLKDKTSHKDSVLARERELRELKAQLKKHQHTLADLEQEQQAKDNVLKLTEAGAQELQRDLREVMAQLGKAQGEINAKHKHQVYLQERQRNLQQEIQQHEEVLAAAATQLEEMRNVLEDAQSKKDMVQKQYNEDVDAKNIAERSLQQAQEEVMKQRQAMDANTMRLEMLQTQIKYLQDNLKRTEQKLNSLKEERITLANNLQTSEEPIAAAAQELESKVHEQFSIQQELQNAKQKLEVNEQALSEQQNKLALLLEEIQGWRDKMEQLRLKIQELITRSESYVQQAQDQGEDINEVVKTLESEVTIEQWEAKIKQIAARIERLGAINLAAIEEFASKKERQEYLDAQNTDLVTALETLRTAIKKIDSETKDKFQQVFTAVNTNFQELFPKVFGGGKASLELAGDDWLEAGVSIMAHPPGKRNSSIHLLSGGEKALTAIALIFAIFKLNPAPFCMLDEVDAPLDDSNVGRFCKLVKEMASAVQLIFISHNKLTLEIADQLTGITMQEPGVSRVVEVDVQQALEWAEKDG